MIEQTERALIENIAIAWVCPLNFNPTTPYERGEVMRLVKFAEDVIRILGYVKLPPDCAILEGISNLANIGDTQFE